MFTPFTNADWMGMAGSERFSDGAEPLVNDNLTVDGLDAFAVIDGAGFYMAVLTPDGETISDTGAEQDMIAALRFVATLKEDYETGELTDMGIRLVPYYKS